MFVTSVDWIRLPLVCSFVTQISVIAQILIINIISSWKSGYQGLYFSLFLYVFRDTKHRIGSQLLNFLLRLRHKSE